MSSTPSPHASNDHTHTEVPVREFDFIVIGSGPGGAPVACRLAQAGYTVAVLEAGTDTGTNPYYQVPGYHGAATEAPEQRWDEHVRHYENATVQVLDKKRIPGTQDVLYPRASALGGCSAHHAMISVYGCDDAWARLMNLTKDPSWHPDRMRSYFERLERKHYNGGFSALGRWWQRLVAFVKNEPLPEMEEKPTGEGYTGWLGTSIADPAVGLKDVWLRHALLRVLAFTELQNINQAVRAFLRLIKGRLYRDFDINDADTMRESPEGLTFIPTSIYQGRRHGPREFLLETQRRLPAHLFIFQERTATRLILEDDPIDPTHKPKRVTAVQCARGKNLHAASPSRGVIEGTELFRARHEVIVACGAFKSPQLLMVSGIGASGNQVSLPGVGQNLRDRYEVSIVSDTKNEFSALAGATFDPERTKDDPAWAEWERTQTGIYASNGGAIAFLKRSEHAQKLSLAPDLFIFGFPASFTGYYPHWAKHLLTRPSATLINEPEADSKNEKRSLWTWVVLKAHSHNCGYVKLKSADADVFQRLDINFNYFDLKSSGTTPTDEGAIQDLNALREGIKHVRQINHRMGDDWGEEVIPGADHHNDDQLNHWIIGQAWGHHACGTCRIGSVPWQADPSKLSSLGDEGAVLDSEFRVHGVTNLRVVDASVFPEIPGYFIAVPIYCISEKAADVIIQRTRSGRGEYPLLLEDKERAAINERRKLADVPEQAKTVGLALSGGGIRSATTCLGVIQQLARLDKLRHIDFLSTVSGGGYIGCFLGALFHRHSSNDPRDSAKNPRDSTKDPRDSVKQSACAAVRRTLIENNSKPISWLRTQANYVAPGGGTDVLENLAIYWRSVVSLHMVTAMLCIGLFAAASCIGWGIASLLPDWMTQAIPVTLPKLPPVIIHPTIWWLLPPLIIGTLGFGCSLAYWLVSRSSTSGMSWRPLIGLLVLALVAYLLGLLMPDAKYYLHWMAVFWLTSLFWWQMSRPKTAATSNQNTTADEHRANITTIMGRGIAIIAASTVFAIIDTLAQTIAAGELRNLALAIGGLVATVAPFLYSLASKAQSLVGAGKEKEGGSSLLMSLAVPLGALLLGGTLVVAYDVAAHAAFISGNTAGYCLLAACITISLVFRDALSFANLSSLQRTYAVRLKRTYLGAANLQRHEGRQGNVLAADDHDDVIKLTDYKPHEKGGPIHLINLCINETVDDKSQRQLRDRKGTPMAVSPLGISINRFTHALWEPEPDTGAPPGTLRARAILNTNASFHPLAWKNCPTVAVESLKLSDWIAISGAAFTTGTGYRTKPTLALLCALVNIRLGYWWDSSLGYSDRFGRRLLGAVNWLLRAPQRLFPAQNLLMAEAKATFTGTTERYWYLSDGGHFENTGLYELIRRRIHFMICIDAGQDSAGEHEDLGGIVRKARIDFDADIHLGTITADSSTKLSIPGRGDFVIPAEVLSFINVSHVGSRTDFYEHKAASALAAIFYDGHATPDSWLLILKPTLPRPDFPTLDVESYARMHKEFPNQSTLDQVFDEAQWESYRALAEQMAARVLK